MTLGLALACFRSCVVRATRPTRRAQWTAFLCGTLVAACAMTLAATCATASPLVWSAPQAIDPGSSITSASCPSTTFCAAVDSQGGVVRFDGSSWSAPADVDGSRSISSVSCPSASFCAAVDAGGYAVTYNGISWSTPQNADSPTALKSVSCLSSSWCEAVDSAGYTVSFDGQTWSRGDQLKFPYTLSSVSCASMSFCVATEQNGDSVFTFDGSFWSAPISLGAVVGPSRVSCHSSVFCVLVSDTGEFATYNGTSWTPPAAIEAGTPIDAVSCPTNSFCVAADEDHFVAIGDGHTWTQTHLDGGVNFLSAASCASATFCAVFDNAGNVLTSSVSVAPTFDAPPTIVGNPQVGQWLDCRSGRASGNPQPDLGNTFFQRDGTTLTDTVNGYTVQSADVGHTLTCTQTARNIAGEAIAASTPVIVTGAPSTSTPRAVTPPATSAQTSGTSRRIATPNGSIGLPHGVSLHVVHGVTRVRLTCVSTGPCDGTARLIAIPRRLRSDGCPRSHGKRPSRCSIGAARFHIAARASRLVSIRLNPLGTTMLRAAHNLTVELTITSTGAGHLTAPRMRLHLT